MSDQEEIWKDIEGYEGKYQVSNMGRVKSFSLDKKDGKLLKPSPTTYGYLGVHLSLRNKERAHYIHRLIAQHFIPNPENKKTINHIDGNKQNNGIENLEWATNLENNLHCIENNMKPNHRSGRNYKGKIQVFDGSGNLIDELSGHADMVSKGYDAGSVCRYIRGERKHSKGFIFKLIPETLLDKRKDVVYEIFKTSKNFEIFEKTGICVSNIYKVKRLLKKNGIGNVDDYERYIGRDRDLV